MEQQHVVLRSRKAITPSTAAVGQEGAIGAYAHLARLLPACP
jgi:hypothetical protein